MRVTVYPAKAEGIVSAPPSKSMAHRLLICAGFARGVSRICGAECNEDILATLDCLRQLGADCQVAGDVVTVTGADPRTAAPAQMLHCRESGSTLRFLIPASLLCGKAVTFTGSETLLSRPLGAYERLCPVFERGPQALRVQGSLPGGEYEIAGDVSSQFITGLLLALPLAEQDSRIRITGAIESKSYIDLTLQALGAFGVTARWLDARTLFVPGGQRYEARQLTVEGDYSGAAFYSAINALGGRVRVLGLDPDSLQGDRVCDEYLKKLCAGCPTIDLSDCPDLAPVLFAVAAARHGAVFTGTRRLKLKESDRAAAMAEELAAFGTRVTVEENTVTVTPAAFHKPDRVLQGHNDHRVVMALAVLLTVTGGCIEGAQAVRKSFPDFFDKLQMLGVRVETD